MKRYLPYILMLVLVVVSISCLNKLNKPTYQIERDLSEKIVKLVFEYTDRQTIENNAIELQQYFTEECFGVVDNRIIPVLLKRFNRYTPTKTDIQDIIQPYNQPNIVYVISKFNNESDLDARLIKLTFNKQHKVLDYEEYYLGNDLTPINYYDMTTVTLDENEFYNRNAE